MAKSATLFSKDGGYFVTTGADGIEGDDSQLLVLYGCRCRLIVNDLELCT